MLVLPIKKQWYDMILSGKKKEEYREIKPYYTTRFLNCGLIKEKPDYTAGMVAIEPHQVAVITFRNGYSETSPSFRAICEISVGKGRLEWGAEPGKVYYILHILSIE